MVLIAVAATMFCSSSGAEAMVMMLMLKRLCEESIGRKQTKLGSSCLLGTITHEGIGEVTFLV